MFDVNEQKKHVKHRIILLLILASFKMLNLVLASLFMLIETILFSDDVINMDNHTLNIM